MTEDVTQMLGRELQAANQALMEMSRQRAAAYEERDMLVAGLTKAFPSHITRHIPAKHNHAFDDEPGPDCHGCDEDWDPQWLNVICVHLPSGIARWHVHVGEMPWFAHLNGVELDCPVQEMRDGYEGYDMMEKYKILSRVPVLWLQGFYIGGHRGKGQSARFDFPGPDGPTLPGTRPGS